MRKLLMTHSRLQMTTAVTLFILTLSASAFAAGGGGHAEYTAKDWLWPVVNFGILIFILVFFGRKPLGEFFKNRTALIEKNIKEATEAKELAEKTLKEVENRLKNTDSEINQIIESARKSGEKEKERLIAEGEKMKEKILEQAKANIEFELEKAKETLKSDASLLALEMAEKQIKDQLGQQEQENLIDGYIKRLEAKN